MSEKGWPVFGRQPVKNAGLGRRETDAWLRGSPEAHGSRKIGNAQAAVTIETEQSSHARSPNDRYSRYDRCSRWNPHDSNWLVRLLNMNIELRKNGRKEKDRGSGLASAESDRRNRPEHG